VRIGREAAAYLPLLKHDIEQQRRDPALEPAQNSLSFSFKMVTMVVSLLTSSMLWHLVDSYMLCQFGPGQLIVTQFHLFLLPNPSREITKFMKLSMRRNKIDDTFIFYISKRIQCDGHEHPSNWNSSLGIDLLQTGCCVVGEGEE
jgi:hypothetical protein